MLKLFVILGFAAFVASGEFCSNGDSYSHIYRVGTNTCPCSAENKGALRFQNDVLEICNGKEYITVGGGGKKPGLGSKDNPALSCRQILKANPGAKSGMYFLKKPGSGAEPAYCYMGVLCGEKGWTMILKADGNKATFGYDSKVWTNQDIINPAGAAGGLNQQETKLHTYHTFSFDRLCVGMKTGGFKSWQKLSYVADSLYSLIRGDVYHPTNIGRDAWKKLVPGSSLQRNCNKEGFNVRISKDKGPSRVRIGIIGNQENECHSPDSRIGIGGAGTHCGQDNSNSVGNTAKCHPDNGNKNIKSFGYVFAADGLSVGSRNNPGASCKDIKLKNKNAIDGVYYLKLGAKIIQTFCAMGSICGNSGWGMIMKMDGAKKTFLYGSKLWMNKELYNPLAARGGLDKIETKLETYNLLPFNNLCVGMRVGNDAIRWLKIPVKASSLYSLIADGKYRATKLGRNAWKSLLKDGSLQKHCNKEGFNAYHKGARARIGIISNQENDCNSPDSRIAFGGEGGHCGQNNNHSVGNEAKCWPDNWDRSTAAFGYIMAQ